ncbi:hypothetical protein [Streptomyces sp. NPDC021212]|uniref:hypothetical protein n=1 Tax=Streptomyces sp. NPDC021212 TaxID=3365118 RepID=UPI00378FDD5A
MFSVADVSDETDTIKTPRLVRTDGIPLDSCPAGAHIDVDGPTGITRPYSLCGPPEDSGGYTMAVKREEDSRGGSQALHDKVAPGTQLTIVLHPGLGRQTAAEVLATELAALPAAVHVYFCGPQGFMDQVAALAARTLPGTHVHRELFQAGELPAGCESSEVELDTGEVCTVPADTSIADVLEENGVPL